MADIKFKIKIN